MLIGCDGNFEYLSAEFLFALHLAHHALLGFDAAATAE